MRLAALCILFNEYALYIFIRKPGWAFLIGIQAPDVFFFHESSYDTEHVQWLYYMLEYSASIQYLLRYQEIFNLMLKVLYDSSPLLYDARRIPPRNIYIMTGYVIISILNNLINMSIIKLTLQFQIFTYNTLLKSHQCKLFIIHSAKKYWHSCLNVVKIAYRVILWSINGPISRSARSTSGQITKRNCVSWKKVKKQEVVF